jgi:hypothetical protein
MAMKDKPAKNLGRNEHGFKPMQKKEKGIEAGVERAERKKGKMKKDCR